MLSVTTARDSTSTHSQSTTPTLYHSFMNGGLLPYAHHMGVWWPISRHSYTSLLAVYPSQRLNATQRFSSVDTDESPEQLIFVIIELQTGTQPSGTNTQGEKRHISTKSLSFLGGKK